MTLPIVFNHSPVVDMA